ncbi:hypothetical protein Tco_0126490 [Tanacetum coccineum]
MVGASPNLDEDKGGKAIDPIRFRDADNAGFMTHRRSYFCSAQFLGQTSACYAGHPKKAEKVLPSPLQRLNPSAAIRCCASNPLECALNCETMDLRSTKFMYCDNRSAMP